MRDDHSGRLGHQTAEVVAEAVLFFRFLCLGLLCSLLFPKLSQDTWAVVTTLIMCCYILVAVMWKTILGGVVGLFAVIVGVFLVTHKEDYDKGEHELEQRAPGCVSDPHPVFTHYPTDIDKVALLIPPLIKVSSGMKGHSYIEVTERVPVYAPADAVLTKGVKYREDLGGRGDLDQYTFTLVVSCEVSYFFDHVIEPPAPIAQAFAGPAVMDSHSRMVGPLAVKGGEFLGYSAGTGQHNFDFGVVNTTQRTLLADDPAYNHSEKFVHADCPYAYFDDEKRAVLFDLLGYSTASDLVVIDNLCAE